MIDKLNSGEIKANSTTIVQSTPSENKTSDANKKKQNKKPKVKKNRGKNAHQHESNEEADIPQFKIQSLFNKEFTSLIGDKTDNHLNLKPSDFWRKIVTLAKKLYDFKLEPDLSNVKCRDSYKNKVAFLRDF